MPSILKRKPVIKNNISTEDSAICHGTRPAHPISSAHWPPCIRAMCEITRPMLDMRIPAFQPNAGGTNSAWTNKHLGH